MKSGLNDFFAHQICLIQSDKCVFMTTDENVKINAFDDYGDLLPC